MFLDSKDIYLNLLSINDNLESYCEWLKDQETTIYMDSGRFPVTIESLKEYIANYKGLLLGIFEHATSSHIGNIALYGIDWRNRRADMGILIGDKKARRKGYGNQALGLVINHAFNRLNLRKLCVGVVKENEASMRLFKSVGFQAEGVLKEHFYLDGKYLDCIRMGLLK